MVKIEAAIEVEIEDGTCKIIGIVAIKGDEDAEADMVVAEAVTGEADVAIEATIANKSLKREAGFREQNPHLSSP